MKYTWLLVSLTVMGCNTETDESYNFKVGDKVKVITGFYKDCFGIVTDYNDYKSFEDDIYMMNVYCPNGVSMSHLHIEARKVNLSREVE